MLLSADNRLLPPFVFSCNIYPIITVLSFHKNNKISNVIEKTDLTEMSAKPTCLIVASASPQGGFDDGIGRISFMSSIVI